MERNAGLGVVLLLASLSAGCVTRSYVITSDPPGALVYRNGVPLGTTPVDDRFIYYGTYEFVLVKEGYEPLRVQQKIPIPWYEWPGFDFVSENLWPGKLRDVHRFHYQLQPLQRKQPDEVLNRAGELRNRGKALEPLNANPPPPPAAPRQPVAPSGTVMPPADAPPSVPGPKPTASGP
jgi:hypothetical protein